MSYRSATGCVGCPEIREAGLFGRGSTHALGLRFTLPTGGARGPLGPVSWWGTVPTATVPAWGLAIAYEGALARWVWHVHVGLHELPSLTYYMRGDLFDLDAIVATVQPVAPGWSVVGEVEVLTGPSPLHVRALARRELASGWTADVGIAVPPLAFFADPTLQIVGGMRRSW